MKKQYLTKPKDLQMSYLNVLKEVKQTVANEGIALSNDQLRLVADTIFNTIASHAQETSIRVPAFGTFKTKIKAARPEREGRNPSTGEALTIAAQPERPYLAFKQSKVAE